MVCKKDIGQSVINTLTYAGFYNSSLTSKEIYLRLISSKPISLSQVERSIGELKQRGKLKTKNGRYSVAQISDRTNSDFKQKLNKAKKDLRVLKKIPWLKFIGISGSVASHSSKKDDDIDVVLITSHHRLWLTRLLVMVLMRISGKKIRRYGSSFYKDYYCFNLLLSEPDLKLPPKKRNLFNAYQLYFIESILDNNNLKEKLYLQNKFWVKKYLANFANTISKDDNSTAGKSFDANILGINFGKILSWIDDLAYKAQRAYMSKKLKKEIISRNYAFFHPEDNSRIISEKLN